MRVSRTVDCHDRRRNVRRRLTILLVAAFFVVFSAAMTNEKVHEAQQWIEQEVTEEPLLSRLHKAKLQEDAQKARQWIGQEAKKNLGL
jgi:ABC-type transporter MlaC component